MNILQEPTINPDNGSDLDDANILPWIIRRINRRSLRDRELMWQDLAHAALALMKTFPGGQPRLVKFLRAYRKNFIK